MPLPMRAAVAPLANDSAAGTRRGDGLRVVAVS